MSTWSIGSRPRAQRSAGRIADYHTSKDFVVLDEFGYFPFAQSGGKLLFQLISRLYEHTSITTTQSSCLPAWSSFRKLNKNSPENSAVVAKAFAAVLNRPKIAAHRGCRRILTF